MFACQPKPLAYLELHPPHTLRSVREMFCLLFPFGLVCLQGIHASISDLMSLSSLL